MSMAVWSAAALLLTLPIMFLAAREDWRDRMVSDRYWDVLGLGGGLFFCGYSVAVSGLRWDLLAAALAAVLAWAAVRLPERGDSVTAALCALVLDLLVIGCGPRDALSLAWAAVPIMALIYTLMYAGGLVRGGADVKCLIALSMAFPIYPAAGAFPFWGLPDLMAAVFVFSLSVLFTAALSLLVLVPYCLWRNRGGPDRGRRRWTGWRIPLDGAEKAFVWPSEDVRDGRVVYIGNCADEETAEVYGRLRAAGAETVAVTPMIPFIVPLALAVPFAALIGSPFALFALFL